MSIDQEAANRKLALRLLRDSIGAMRGKYVLFLLVIMAVAAVSLAPPQLYQLFFQSIEDNSTGIIKKLFAFGTLIAACTFVATALSVYAREWLRCEIEATLRKKVLAALSVTSLEQLENVNRGEWIACTSDDLIESEDFLTLSFPDQIKNMLIFIGSTALFLYYGGFYGAILIALAIGLILLNVMIQKKLQPALQEIRGLHAKVYQQLLENFEGLRTIRSFGGENMVQNSFSDKLRIINAKSLSIIRHFASLIGINEFIILLGVTTILGLILYNFNMKKLSLEDAMIYPFYLGIFFSSVASFYRSNFDWTMFFTKASRLARLIYHFADANNSKPQPLLLSSFNQGSSQLSFKNIELKYALEPLLVPPFDLVLKKHEILGIIGPSGCGKSTLLEFLAGLRPLMVDGKNTMLSTSLASYVEQSPYIFEGSIADNLRFGCNINISDQQMWAALEKARLAQVFLAKKGLDFKVHERGQNLSEGEKYRLGIARAILASKPFLLMDEPFSALDHVSIKAIVDLILSERGIRGIVVVTHYIPTELEFDNILDFSSLTRTNKPKLINAQTSYEIAVSVEKILLRT